MRFSSRIKFLSITLIMIAATLLAYGDALRLPFFFDDMTHYVWLHGQSLGSIFVSAAGRPYYRPMQFFLWKVYETITGVDSVVFYHALSLIMHVIGALLIVVLVRRLDKARDRWWPAMLAGLIFTLYPFSYQVVTLPASFTHPMVVFFVVLAVLAYDSFRTSHQKRWLILSLVCGLLAFGSNEGSLLLFGIIALVEWVQPYTRKQWRWTVVFAVMAVLYYIWYQTRPHEISNGFGLRNLETIIQNTIYALQGLTFPLQPVGRVLMEWGLNDQVAVLIIGAIALVALAVLFTRAKQIRRFVIGVGWYAVCLAAPVLILSHDYFINAPRVLYLGSIGAAYVWANAVAIIAAPPIVRRALAVIAAVIILLPSFIFIRQRMDLHNLNAAPLSAALDVAMKSPPADELLFVNLPAWISTPRLWYPIGHEGALFMPSYSTLADFVSTNLDRTSQAVGVEFNSLSTPQPYYYGVYGPALGWAELTPKVYEAERVYFTLYSPDQIGLVEAGRLIKQPDSSVDIVAKFDESIVLEKIDRAQCEDRLQIKLNWRSTQVINTDLHVFVHILNPDGTLAAQHDSPPIMGLRPFWQWLKGDQVEDIHPIDLSTLPRDRTYTIAVGLYDPANGQRLTPTLTNGDQPADKAVRLGMFTIGASDDCR